MRRFFRWLLGIDVEQMKREITDEVIRQLDVNSLVELQLKKLQAKEQTTSHTNEDIISTLDSIGIKVKTYADGSICVRINGDIVADGYITALKKD